MRALTLHQPWASLIAAGLKTFETRSWATPYRGRIAIHAGQTLDEDATRHLIHELLDLEERSNAAAAARGVLAREKPLGAVVCTAVIVDVIDTRVGAPTDLEWLTGDWSHGRYAWQLADVRVVSPVPCRGAQGLWTLPPEIEQQVRS